MSADIRDFLARVLPWPTDDDQGYINTHVMGKSGDRSFWTGTPTRTLDQFLTEVNAALKWRTPPDIFMCLSRQAKTRVVNGKVRAAKHAEDAICLKSVWLDIDVGKPIKSNGTPLSYSEIGIAITELMKFCAAIGIPSPTALVASGGGIHAYWISKKALTLEEWRPYAFGLKQAALNYGLLCDAGITGDAARVLRVPGTLNFKTQPPRPVTLKFLKPEDLDYETALSVLPTLSQVATIPVAQTRPKFSGSPAVSFQQLPMESLATGLETEPILLDLVSAAEAGCGWLKEAITTGGRDFSQGLWNLSTLAATFAEDGHALAHWMAKGHRDYSYDDTEKLWLRKVGERGDRGLGWPSCRAIQAEGCLHCGTCSKLALGKSPLNLSRIHQSNDGTQPLPKDVPRKYFRPPPLTDDDLPEGFVIRNGRVHSVEEVKTKGGQTSTEYKLLIHNELFEPWTQKAETASGGKWGLNFKISLDKGNYGDRFIDQGKLHLTKLLDHLYAQQILPNAKNHRNLEVFFVAWIDKLHQAAEAAEAKSFGWSRHPDTGKLVSFTYGGKSYHLDGTVQSAGYIERGMKDVYQPRGDKQAWLDGCKALTDMKRPGLECIVAAGFASPLLVATGHYSGFLSVCGDSGSGKTTAAKLALAIWANPKLAKEGPTSTVRSVLNKTGRTKNIPVVWDEIMDEASQETVHKALFVNALGAEGSRLNSDITVQTKGDWQTISIICSNPSFSDFVIKKNPSTAAGLYRLIEYKENELGGSGVMSEIDATRLYGTLDWNYGRIGEEYALLMTENWPTIEKEIIDTSKWFEAKCGLTKGERYWGAIAATLTTGAKLGNMLGASFDVKSMEDFLILKILENRNIVSTGAVKGGSIDNAEMLLTAFLKCMAGKTLRTRTLTTAVNKRGRYMVECVQYPLPQNPVQVQWDLAKRELYLSQREFNNWLRSPAVNASPRLTKEGLEQYFMMTVKRKSLGAETIYTQGQEEVMIFPIPAGSDLETQMNSYETPKEG